MHFGEMADRAFLRVKILALSIQTACPKQVTQFNPSLRVSMPMNIKQEAILKLSEYLRLSAGKECMVFVPSAHCCRIALRSPFHFSVWVHALSVEIRDDDMRPFARACVYLIREGQRDVSSIVVRT